VLVVDDELDIRESLEILLSSEGLFRRSGAERGRGDPKDGDQRLRPVLLDLMMPDRSGMDVLQESASATAKPPFMITAYGSWRPR